MFAVIKTGGKQYKVAQNQTIKIEKLAGNTGDEISFEEVLLVADEANDSVQIGKPQVAGAIVKGKILEQGKDKKIDVIKYKNKTRYRRKYGHRQPFTRVAITSIVA